MSTKRLTLARSLALRAGALLRDAYRGSKRIQYKGRIDLLTNYDLESHNLIVKGIQEAFPQDAIISEEGIEQSSLPDAWLIDPLDGTTNFVSGLPDFTISIAYLQDSNPVLGVIYNPPVGDLFHAERNKGAFLNDEIIKVSQTDALIESVLAEGFPYDLEQITFDPFDAWTRIFYKTRGIRHVACASLTMAYVAAGRIEAYWEEGCYPWDLAAGMLLVTEAGGSISRIDGSTNPLRQPCSVLASNGHLHHELTELLEAST